MHQLFGHGVLGLAVKDELVYYGLQRHAADGVVGFLRAVRAMGCDDAARVCDQGLVGCGLVGEHVERGAADAARTTAGNALVQRGDQGILIHDGPAGRVNQKRRGLHECELALSNEALGLGNQRTMQAKDI